MTTLKLYELKRTRGDKVISSPELPLRARRVFSHLLGHDGGRSEGYSVDNHLPNRAGITIALSELDLELAEKTGVGFAIAKKVYLLGKIWEPLSESADGSFRKVEIPTRTAFAILLLADPELKSLTGSKTLREVYPKRGDVSALLSLDGKLGDERLFIRDGVPVSAATDVVRCVEAIDTAFLFGNHPPQLSASLSELLHKERERSGPGALIDLQLGGQMYNIPEQMQLLTLYRDNQNPFAQVDNSGIPGAYFESNFRIALSKR